jgi:anti-sigma regulatory factor (Ser/Thr protein kinase)
MSNAPTLCAPAEPVLVHQRLACTPEAASRARRIVEQVDWPDIDTMVLLASELIANAVRYSGSQWLDLIIGLTVDGELHLQVIDEGLGDTTPHLRRVDDDAVAGRGLHLIKHYSVRWGFMMDTAGVTVWCDIADTPPPEPRFADHAAVVCAEDGR